MNHKKFGRFIGVGQSYGGSIPDVLVQLPLDRLARSPASGGVQSGVAKSYHGWRYIDPPVGGFADGDILEALPYQFAHRTITGVHTPDLNNRFAPGLYRIGIGWQLGNVGSAVGAYWKIYNAAPELGWAIEGSDTPEFGFVMSATASSAGVMCGTERDVYLPGFWYMVLKAVGAWADSDIAFTQVDVTPIHLLDEYSSAR